MYICQTRMITNYCIKIS